MSMADGMTTLRISAIIVAHVAVEVCQGPCHCEGVPHTSPLSEQQGATPSKDSSGQSWPSNTLLSLINKSTYEIISYVSTLPITH